MNKNYKIERDYASEFILKFTTNSCEGSFCDFVKIPSNSLATQAFSSISGYMSSGVDLGVFNPIYLHGLSGVGKTHLLNATVSHLRACGHLVYYSSCDQFTEAVIRTIRSGCLWEFQKKLRSCSVFVIDEISELFEKWRIQEEFFHAFNEMHINGKQVIVSSRSHPSALEGVESRLISRFEWGLVIPVFEPGFVEQKEFICSFAKLQGKDISEHLVDLLIKEADGDFSKLRVILGRSLFGADSVIKNKITVDDILEVVAKHFGIGSDDLKSSSQKKSLVLPRRIVMYLCRELSNMSLSRIGMLFKKDHATAHVAHKKISDGVLSEGPMRVKIKTIMKELDAG